MIHCLLLIWWITRYLILSIVNLIDLIVRSSIIVKLLTGLFQKIWITLHHIHSHFHHFGILDHLFLLFRHTLKLRVWIHNRWKHIRILLHHFKSHFHILWVHHLRVKIWRRQFLIIHWLFFIFFFCDLEIFFFIFQIKSGNFWTYISATRILIDEFTYIIKEIKFFIWLEI